ncbi:MAG: DNA-3-methyladenine glycosylase [Legionellales bacterium]|nr:DNA-3-methyladenine glycosylase [Legionellales bacterium]
MLTSVFFEQDAQSLARVLLGKVLWVRQQTQWLAAQIIETEAYYQAEKASHASLGYTEKRKALFMPAGTIYMYYARGGDSFNISAQGEGNAVLIKSAVPWRDHPAADAMLATMQRLNPPANGIGQRPWQRLCAGQTLLCKALGLTVREWDQQTFQRDTFYIADQGYDPTHIIRTTRLGIPTGRDEQLWYRFIDHQHAAYCTSNPLTRRNWRAFHDYLIESRV